MNIDLLYHNNICDKLFLIFIVRCVMKLYPLTCSNCGASIEIQDGIDVYYCKTCGYKMILEGQSNAAYNAKMKVKGMEHE